MIMKWKRKSKISKLVYAPRNFLPGKNVRQKPFLDRVRQPGELGFLERDYLGGQGDIVSRIRRGIPRAIIWDTGVIDRLTKPR